MTDYEKICCFQNLYAAFKASSRGRRHKSEVIKFEMNLSFNLWKLKNELEQKKYKVNGYYSFKIYEPKEREIQALYYRDRIVQHSLCDNVLRDFFEKRLIYDNGACRIGKGTHFSMRRLIKFMRDFYKIYGSNGYILKCDIKKYFASINKEILKKKLLDKIPDADVLNLIIKILDSYNTPNGKGLPIGNQTSQWFGLYYLDKMDRLVKEKLQIKYYTRYMDDMILIHKSKDYLKVCLNEMQKLAQNLDVEFNNKTQIFPIKNGVDYLGFRFYLTDTGKVIRRLRTSNKKRFKRRLKKFAKDYKAGKKSIQDITQSLTSYCSHLKHGHTYKLKKKILSSFVLQKS